ncbi:MAG TPA: hypothetical protein VNN77_09295 [candidate division Zixibacteria bacterium]|nr:hypothetical protein [candidate division Zixibacteria bacterium]
MTGTNTPLGGGSLRSCAMNPFSRAKSAKRAKKRLSPPRLRAQQNTAFFLAAFAALRDEFNSLLAPSPPRAQRGVFLFRANGAKNTRSFLAIFAS